MCAEFACAYLRPREAELQEMSRGDVLHHDEPEERQKSEHDGQPDLNEARYVRNTKTRM